MTNAIRMTVVLENGTSPIVLMTEKLLARSAKELDVGACNYEGRRDFMPVFSPIHFLMKIGNVTACQHAVLATADTLTRGQRRHEHNTTGQKGRMSTEVTDKSRSRESPF